MNKIKSIFNGPHRGFVWFCVAAVAAFLISWLAGPGNTFIHWIRAKREINAQERIMERYSREIDEMEKRLKDLNEDRDSLEKFAVEKFNFSHGGEDVYIVE